MLRVPMEAKRDYNGLFYIDNDYFKQYPLYFDNYIEKNERSSFYELISTSDYIIKCGRKLNRKKVINMLLKFKEYQEYIKKTDFPIGYYEEDNIIKGLIIPYYNSPSLLNIKRTHDLGELSKFYYHDDNSIHNLYLLCLDIIDIIEEMYCNEIYYTDIHDGNFVFKDNNVKLIDFDPNLVFFSDNKKRENYNYMMYWCENIIYTLTKYFNLEDLAYRKINSFDKMRTYVKKIENRVTKNR